MKRIYILCLITIYISSCASITPSNWSMKGDVTAYNHDGSVLKTWENVVIESGTSNTFTGTQVTSSSTKSFGLNFIDPKSGKGVIIGNAVPYIIEYNTNKEYEQNNTSSESTTTINGYSQEQMKNWIDTLDKAYNSNKDIIKSKTASKEEKQQAKKANVAIFQKLQDAKDEYYKTYNRIYK